MNPKPNFFKTPWSQNGSKASPGNEYLSHNKQDYLTPGQKAFMAPNFANPNPQFKENQHFQKWDDFLTPSKAKHEGFRSNTGQYSGSGQLEPGPQFANFNSRHSFFNEEKTLELKIQEQEFEFSRTSRVPQDFRLEYVEYQSLPHVSQFTPGFPK